jgi:hypothetical protein
VQKKRPCSECRRWFVPDARVGSRQRTCGSAECRRARHRRADRAWHERHPDYDRARRWEKKLAKVQQGGPIEAPDRAPLAGVPWDLAQDVMEPQAVVIITELAGFLVRHAQAERRKQVREMAAEFGRHRPGGAQDEMERGPPC